MAASPSRSPAVVIRLFGPARLEVDGRVVDSPHWRRRPVRALVTMLALAPGAGLHRDEIVDAIWPELDPTSAANQLHKTVHFLRRALEAVPEGRRAISVSSERVSLSSWVTVDVRDFLTQGKNVSGGADTEALEAILAAAGDRCLEQDPYEDWADEARGQVDAMRRSLLGALAARHLDEGRLDDAARAFREILAEDRADEAAHRGLMRIAARQDDWRAAVMQYHSCREALWLDLAVEPATETERLRQEILFSMSAGGTQGKRESRAALLEELGDALRESGQATKAVGLYSTTLSLIEPTDHEVEKRVRGKLALAHIVSGDLAAAEAQIGPIRDELEREWPAYLTARTLYLLAQLRWHSGRYREALDAAERAVAAARSSADLEQQARAQEVFALACHALGDWRRGIQAELERERIAAETGFGEDEVLEAHLCLWEYSLYGDRPFAEVRKAAQDALDRAEAQGKVAAMAVAEHALGSVLMIIGSWPEARRSLERSLRLARSVGAPQGTVLGLQRLALLDTSAGQLDRGQRLVSEAFEVARASTSAQVRLHSFSRMNATLALNRFLAGDLDAARSAVTAASVVMEEAGECITCDSLIHPVAVPIHLAAGDVSAARHALRKTEATASSFRGHSRTATANHAAGLVLAAEGRWQEAERRLHQAAATFERLGQPYERARSDVALAAVRRMTGRSRDRVGDGTGTMQALGADPDPDRVARWLLPA